MDMTSLQRDFEKAVRNIRAVKPHDTILFTLRHGESIGQKFISAYKTLGDDPLPITRLGVLQSIAVGKLTAKICQFAGITQVDIRTSSGERSSTTALLIHEIMDGDISLEVGMMEDRRLDKQKFGLFDGHFTSAERKAAVPEAYEQYVREEKPKGEFYARPPQGESIDDVRERIRTAVDGYTESHVPIISVTHGTNALCIDDVLMERGEEWILAGLDKRPNCSLHMYTGNKANGFTHHVVADDPLKWNEQHRSWSFNL
jgi:2,3-bisphosphoglycerate-dependent phosphoglycerate mutase